MHAYDAQLEVVARNLRNALYLELFVQLCFIAAGFAMTGAFAGGSPTSTPPFAKVYIVVSFLVTIVVIVRTRQMQAAAERKDLAALEGMHINRWALVALLFSAILPFIYLNVAAASMPRR